MIEALIELGPDALTTEARAMAYMKRERGLEEEARSLLPMWINAATSRFHRHCGRRVLKVRTFRGTSTLSCTHTVSNKTVTGAGFNALKVHDDAVGANAQLGSRIDKITSDTSLDLDKSASATGVANLTFGSEPLTFDGDGTVRLRLEEWPLHAVYSAKYLDQDGNKTALDLTASRIRKDTGELLLMKDVFPKGEMNVQVECLVGYRPPSLIRGETGDWHAWDGLESLCLRMVQVLFQDWAKAVGRGGELDLAAMKQAATNFELPRDIREGLAAYRSPG